MYISLGNSLAVQWLGLCTFTADGVSVIPSQGTKTPQDTRRSQKKIKKKKIYIYIYIYIYISVFSCILCFWGFLVSYFFF